MVQTDKLQTAEDVFAEAQARFSVLRVLRSALHFTGMFGFNLRTRANRVSHLRHSANGRYLSTRLEALSDQGLSFFLGLATVNKEQAEAAFRYTAIVNFTAPITLIVFLSQVLDGGVMGVYTEASPFQQNVLLITAIAFVACVNGLITYAYIGVQTARDIHHLAFLEQARRGGRGVMADVEDEAPISVAET